MGETGENDNKLDKQIWDADEDDESGEGILVVYYLQILL